MDPDRLFLKHVSCLENLRGPRSTVFKACFISWILKEHFLFHTFIIHARLILEDSNWKYTNGNEDSSQFRVCLVSLN